MNIGVLNVIQEYHKGLTCGQMIDIPAWNAFGMVMDIASVRESKDAVRVTLQTYPDQPPAKWTIYTLSPGEYELES